MKLGQLFAQPKEIVEGLLGHADVQVNGNRPQDIQVHTDEFYSRVLATGSLGLGESYMDGQWDAEEVHTFVEQVCRADLQQHVQWNRHAIGAAILARLTNRQNKKRSKRVAREHYDLSSVLPEKLLDPYNQYTCAYFKGTNDLNEAQEKKLDLLCRKLELSEEDSVLDIGCGWGGFARYAAEHYGCHVTGISISEEQIKYATEHCRDLPVEIHNCDYRDLEGSFDKVLTCGMVEHVGYKNYRRLLQTIHDHMNDDGLYLLHTIGSNRSTKSGDPFLLKYIFPEGMAPSVEQIGKARAGLFTLHDVQNLGSHYPPTLLAWHQNFKANWPEHSEAHDERFRRMFEYYLLSCAGGFQAGKMQLWQMVFTKATNVRDYQGVR